MHGMLPVLVWKRFAMLGEVDDWVVSPSLDRRGIQNVRCSQAKVRIVERVNRFFWYQDMIRTFLIPGREFPSYGTCRIRYGSKASEGGRVTENAFVFVGRVC